MKLSEIEVQTTKFFKRKVARTMSIFVGKEFIKMIFNNAISCGLVLYVIFYFCRVYELILVIFTIIISVYNYYVHFKRRGSSYRGDIKWLKCDTCQNWLKFGL